MKHFDVTPVTGFLDSRSSPDKVGVGGWRMVKNFGVEQKLKLCRMPGWKKLLDRESYNNSDLHDQLLSITGGSARKPITFLLEAQSTFGTTKLLAGTDNAVYAFNITNGNWKVIWSGFGADGLRVYGTQNQDVVIFSNDFDQPMYWTFDQPGTAAPIDDLVALDVTRVGVVITWAGCTFLMNVVQEGQSVQQRVIWSDFQNGLSYLKGDESFAGDQDLDDGEAILGALPMANLLLIYTTRGIWQVTQSASADQPFTFAKRYDSGKSGESCLAYKNTLVSNGNEHIYMAQEGIHVYSLFKDKPERVEWIHRASNLIYDDLNTGRCDTHVAAYNPLRKEIWISWARSADENPTQTLVLNTEFAFSAIVDHGFTSFVIFQPQEPVTLLQDFILANCICTTDELAEFAPDAPEGGFCEQPDSITCESQPTLFYNETPLELEDGIIMEDWNQPDPTPGSLCDLLSGITLASTCVSETAGACKPSRLFVMASSLDFCLKEMATIYYREVCVSFGPCGTYEKRGYKSLLRSGPINVRDTEDEKIIKNFVLEAEAAVAVTPGQVKLRTGTAMQAVDPNQDTCPILWNDEESKDLQCLTGLTALQHRAEGTRPDTQYEWPMFYVGMNFYFEIEVRNDASTPFLDTGAAMCLSRYSIYFDPSRRRY